nr:filamentous hemagglutinin N-terminal domain-containing protein [Chroococcidiopsis sp. [FACHB-1243]]
MACCIVVCEAGAFAQIVSDRTLPNSSTVTDSGNTSTIEGGTSAGSNLFHSFESFSLPTGNSAYFNNGADITNIFSRVTGRSASNIDGLIRANGGANLFLLNPNGIIFGRNASLNIGGSFVATTADAIGFGDGFEFSARNPQSTPLLTINVPIGLQFGSNAGSVSINGSSLQVIPGRSLVLIGGNVSIDGGKLVAPSGRMVLGGVAGENTIGLFPIGNFFDLNFPQGVPQADVSLTNQAEVNVLSSSGGSIAVNAANLNISGGSQLLTGISGIGSPNTQAGNIEINTTGAVNLDGSTIFNVVQPTGVGRAGDIIIKAESLSVANGGGIQASTFGQGNAGSLRIDARDTVSFNNGSAVFTTVEPGAVGNGNDIQIQARSVSIANGSFLTASTLGKGNAGNVIIEARETVLFDRGNANSSVGIDDYQYRVGEGNGGNISITTGSLALANQAQLLASSYVPQGNAGNVNIEARDRISLSNESYIFSQLVGAAGTAGNINISTGSLWVTDGSILSTDTFGNGNGGNISIKARDTVSFLTEGGAYSLVQPWAVGKGGNIDMTIGSLVLADGSFIAASTLGTGNSGNVTITASDSISLDGVNKQGFSGGLYSETATQDIGDGGNMNISARSLKVTNGARVATDANDEATGSAGSININATDFLSFDGVGSNGVSSGAYSRVETQAAGNANDINITTRSLSLTNGAVVTASTQGRGNAARIKIAASDSVSIDGVGSNGVYSGVSNTVETQAVGNGNDIDIITGTLKLTNGAELSSSSKGDGTAGNLRVNARSIRLDNNALLTASTQSTLVDPNSEQATININSQNLFISRNSNIFTNAEGENVSGGNINIDTDFLIAFENSDISANSVNARGGNVAIDATGIFGIEVRDRPTPFSDITATGANSALSGNVQLNIEQVELNRGLVELPAQVVDTSGLIASSCRAATEGSSFTMTGRGGLPPTPQQELDDDPVWRDRRLVRMREQGAGSREQGGQGRQGRQGGQGRTTNNQLPITNYQPVVEATGWAIAPSGEVMLTAAAANDVLQKALRQPSNCNGR